MQNDLAALDRVRLQRLAEPARRPSRRAERGVGIVGVLHNWIGGRVLQITHEPTYADFAGYIQTNYFSLVAAASGKSVAQTLLAKPDLMLEGTPSGRMLSALAGGWYWMTRNVNTLATS